MKHYSIILGALLASCFLFACTQKEEEQKEIPVESVMISQPTLEITLGQSYRLSAKVFPSNATNPEVEWTSSNSRIANVIDGNVIPRSEGKATIYATAGSKRDQCEVTVVGEFANKTVSSITLNKNETTIKGFESETLVATVFFTDGTTTSHANWSSSNETIATVSNGYVFGINNGDVTITAEFGGKTATCLVHVIETPSGYIAVTSVTLDQTSITMKPWTLYTLVATVKPDNATDKSVHWESSNPNIAHVEDGVVMGMQDGTATITAKAGDKMATCVVTVQEETVAVESLSLNIYSLSMYVGGTYTLKATVTPTNATNKTVSWSSDNTSVATVDSQGVVSALSEGTASITAKAGEKSATCQVSVQRIIAASITLNKTTLTMGLGDSETLIATVQPSNTTETVSWSCSNNSVITVDANGKIEALKAGTATVTARANQNVSASCSVTVIPAMDMGLSVFWHQCNIGASSPEEYGYCYAWGDPFSSSPFKYVYYKFNIHCGDATIIEYVLTKYVADATYGTVDNKTVLEPIDDAAHQKLGDNWRMPTKEEWEELFDPSNCSHEEKKENGKKGVLFTSKITGKSIFFPYAGYYDTSRMWEGTQGYYWSSSLVYGTSGSTLHAWIGDITSNKPTISQEVRWIGLPVRPVYPKQQ